MIKLTTLLKEIKIGKPSSGTFPDNKTLYNFLNRNIKEFAKSELESASMRLSSTILHIIFKQYDWNADPYNFGDEDYFDDTHFLELDPNIQQQAIDYLVEVGLKYNGEWKSEEDNYDIYGTSWNVPDLGIEYNWTDKADSGSYNWSEVDFKGRKFYSLAYDI